MHSTFCPNARHFGRGAAAICTPSRSTGQTLTDAAEAERGEQEPEQAQPEADEPGDRHQAEQQPDDRQGERGDAEPVARRGWGERRVAAPLRWTLGVLLVAVGLVLSRGWPVRAGALLAPCCG